MATPNFNNDESGRVSPPTKRIIGAQNTNIDYIDRHAVRLVITNPVTQEIIIAFVRKGGYYKLPGGGVELDEDHGVAALREAQEETGCKVNIVKNGDPFAITEEWRNNLHQISYGYAADLEKDTGMVALTEDEVADGLQHEWLSLPAAIDKMAACQPTSELGRFIKERDLFLIQAYNKQRGNV